MHQTRHPSLLMAIVCAIVSSATAQTIQIAELNLQYDAEDTCSVLLGGSYLSHAELWSDTIYLDLVAPDSGGIIRFEMTNVQTTDDFRIGFVEQADSTVFFEYRYAPSTDVVAADHRDPNNFPFPDFAKNNKSFFLERCPYATSWYYDQEARPRYVRPGIADTMRVRILVQQADSIQLSLTFEKNVGNCKNCSDVPGSKLQAGDLMFLAYDADPPVGDDRLVLRNQKALTSGTSFTLARAQMLEASGEERWYAGDGTADNKIASYQLTYLGDTPIPAMSRICFDIPDGGGAPYNFTVAGISAEFCVENNGNQARTDVDLPETGNWSVFLMQGNWKYTATHGIWCGRIISGFQFGGAFDGTGSKSDLPLDIACIPIEDINNQQRSLAYYKFYDLAQSRSGLLNNITDFPTGWTSGNGGILPADMCDILNQSALVNAETDQVSVFPNPFSNELTVAWTNPTEQEVQFTFYDVTGKAVWQAQQYLSAGIQRATLRPDIPQTGFYILHILTRQQTQSVQVIYQPDQFLFPAFGSFPSGRG